MPATDVSLYDLATSLPDGLAGELAGRVASWALQDPQWRALYDSVRDNGLPHPERLARVHVDADADYQLLLGLFADPEDVTAGVRDMGEFLGCDTPRVEDPAVVVGITAWRAALGVVSLDRGPAFGPAAVCSLAGVLARAAGSPVPTVVPPGRPVLQLVRPRVVETVACARDWAFMTVGPDQYRSVLRQAASDLAWGADGATLTGAAARVLYASADSST